VPNLGENRDGKPGARAADATLPIGELEPSLGFQVSRRARFHRANPYERNFVKAARNTMKSIFLVCFCATMIGCAESGHVDNRNFAIDTYYPTPNEIQLAEQRARKYWAKHAARFGSNPVYLAIQTSTVFPGEVQLLWPKLINSETTASFFSHGLDKQTYSSLNLLGIMIYDTRTGHFVGNRGFISVDTPPLGGVARFDDYLARYIGFGNWG
jgi:hypothetical protein